MTTPLLTGSTPGTLARVNLLPPEIQERRNLRRVQAGMAAAAAAALGIIGLLYAGQLRSVSTAQSEVAAEQQENTRLQSQLRARQNVREVYARVDAREGLLRQALGQEVQWSRYLNDLSLTMPDNVWLTSFNAQQPLEGGAASAAAAPNPVGSAGIGQVSIAGVAFNHDDVAVWLETLAKQKGYANPYFSTSAETALGARKVVNFATTVSVTPEALSGRYTKQAGE